MEIKVIFYSFAATKSTNLLILSPNFRITFRLIIYIDNSKVTISQNAYLLKFISIKKPFISNYENIIFYYDNEF